MWRRGITQRRGPSGAQRGAPFDAHRLPERAAGERVGTQGGIRTVPHCGMAARQRACPCAARICRRTGLVDRRLRALSSAARLRRRASLDLLVRAAAAAGPSRARRGAAQHEPRNPLFPIPPVGGRHPVATGAASRDGQRGRPLRGSSIRSRQSQRGRLGPPGRVPPRRVSGLAAR